MVAAQRGGVSTKLEILNTEAHRAVRMKSQAGDHPTFVGIVLSEVPAAAAVCPVFFSKHPETGQFYAGAMFGFRPGELLVEGAEAGKALFRPLELQRQGFFIAEENIAIDVDHPRFGEGASIPLFDDAGEPSDSLRRIQVALGQLKAGAEATNDFIRELMALKLLEPIDVSLQFDDGETLQLDGLYTVSRDGLNELDDAQLVGLFRKGYLQAALCISLSMSQVGALAHRRNQLLTSAA
jgi:hypothetical protein